MMKINYSKDWTETPKDLKNFSEENKEFYNNRMYGNRSIAWEDMRGLSWIFINDEVI